MRSSKALTELETLSDLLAKLLGAGLGHRHFQILHHVGEVGLGKNVTDGFSAHSYTEGTFTILIFCFTKLSLGEELAALKRRVAWVNHDMIFIVDHALKRTRCDVQHQANTAWHALVEPDVSDRNGKFDVTHAFTTNAAERHFNAATVTNNALVLDALVFTASTFPVTSWSENTFTEQTAFFRLEGSVIDGFGILHFTVAP